MGLVCLSIADSGFAYLTAIGHYGAVNFIDAGWVAGFLVIAVAAVIDHAAHDATTNVGRTSRTALLLPYIPAAAAIAIVLHQVSTKTFDPTTGWAAGLVAVALVGRQMLVLLDNRSLMIRITHQALHDVLTGLANRALFGDRLSHALELHRRDMRTVTVLLLDLDDFKEVNDSLGHPAGDELLIRVSERIMATVRTGDTVARLGGDEFAILMEDGGDAMDTACRLLLSLDQPIADARASAHRSCQHRRRHPRPRRRTRSTPPRCSSGPISRCTRQSTLGKQLSSGTTRPSPGAIPSSSTCTRR